MFYLKIVSSYGQFSISPEAALDLLQSSEQRNRIHVNSIFCDPPAIKASPRGVVVKHIYSHVPHCKPAEQSSH